MVGNVDVVLLSITTNHVVGTLFHNRISFDLLQSGQSLSGTLSHTQPELGVRVFLNTLKVLFPADAKQVVDEGARTFSIPWR